MVRAVMVGSVTFSNVSPIMRKRIKITCMSECKLCDPQPRYVHNNFPKKPPVL